MNKALRQGCADEISLGELTGALGFLLRMAQVRVFSGFFRKLGDQGLKPGEYSVLYVIGENPGQQQGAIARKLQIKPAHMTKLVQRMVDAGLVERAVDSDDRRSVRLSLTDQGAGFVARHKDAVINLDEGRELGLSAGEYETLMGLLRKVVDGKGTRK